MLLVNLTRIDLLKLLPSQGVVAEIGVAEGEFSRLILSSSSPHQLHLIDPWEHQARIDYQGDTYGNPPASEQEGRFEMVSKEFDSEINHGRVVLHRTYSTLAAESFKEHMFDWIYIDGLHSKEGVSADLNAFQNKMKPDGLILGHDYTNHPPAMKAGFGVVEAVNEFVIDNKLHFLAMTMENFPTYVLTRSPESAVARLLIANIMYYASWMVELQDYPQRQKFQHKAINVGDRIVAFPSFSQV